MNKQEVLILENQGLITYVLRHLHIYSHNPFWSDYYAYGALGLVQAANTYSTKKGAFTTWAFCYIRKSIQTGMVHLTDTIQPKSINTLNKRRGLATLSLDWENQGWHNQIGKTYDVSKNENMEITKEFLKELGSQKLLEWLYSSNKEIRQDTPAERKAIKKILKKLCPNSGMSLSFLRRRLRLEFRLKAKNLCKKRRKYAELFGNINYDR